MEEQPSDSESPAWTANMSGSQDSDSGSEYLSAEEELRTEGGGRAVSPSQAAPASHAASQDREVPAISTPSPPCLAPTALPTSAVPSQTAPVARGPGASLFSGQAIMHGGEGNIGNVHNSGRIDHLGHNYNYGGKNLESIAARTRGSLGKACPQGYVKTSGYYTALGEVRKHGCCIITGTSGSGKTTLARHLLLFFQAEGFEPVEFIQPSECDCLPWKEIEEGNRRLILLVDNVVGAGNFEDELRRKWEIQLKPMKPFIERGQILVVLTSRANIYAAIRGVKDPEQVLYEAPKVSLGEEDCQLSEQVKKEILSKILAFYEAKLPDQVSLDIVIWASNSVTKIGFPQLCFYLATNPAALRHPLTFFQNPVQFLKREFQNLKKNDELSYFVLILVLLQEGTLSEEFMKAPQNKKFFIEVADLVGLPKCPGYGEILERAKQLHESYLEYDSQSKCFTFTHQSVWDVLFSDLCHSDFEQAVKVCTIKQLVMYVRTDPTCEEREEFVYVVPPCHWPILAKRLLQELTNGYTNRACSHPCLQHPDFVQELLKKFLTDTDISRLLETQKEKTGISIRCEIPKKMGDPAIISLIQYDTVAIFSFQSRISFLLLRRRSPIAKHILQSAQFQALSPSTQSQLLTEALACALYASDADMTYWLMERGAAPSQECVRAACSAMQEHVGLVERALQWDSLLSAELLIEMARVARQMDRPRTLELVLSHLPKSASIQAELDVILAQVILLTATEHLTYCNRKLPDLPSILSTLKEAGAQFRSHIDPHTAAGHRDPSALSEWLEHKVDLSVKDDYGRTLLHCAAETGALSNVQALLDEMKSTGQLAELVDVQTKTSAEIHLQSEMSTFRHYGDTALHLAAGKGRLAVVEALLKRNANANVTNDRGETALCKLAGCFQWELEGFISPVEDQEAASSSSHSSGFKSHKHAVSDTQVKDLLNQLMPNTVSLKDTFHADMTPLHAASSKGHCLLVEKLVERGVDVSARDREGRTPVHCAAEKGHVDVLEVLSRNEAQLDARESHGQTALHVAAGRGHLPVVEMLIQNNAKINARDARERTPLHEAAEGGHDQIAKCLLDSGATVNAADRDGQQPLHLAAGRGHFSTVQCLVEGGPSVKSKSDVLDITTVDLHQTRVACVNASDVSGRTPLHWALRGVCFYAAEYLITSGAKVDVEDSSGNTVLHSLAALHSWKLQDDTARLAPLVKSLGELVDCQNKQGDTPVMLAAKHRNYKVLREMLRLQCDLSLKNDAGNTVLHLAAAQKLQQDKEKAEEECMSIICANCVKMVDIKNHDGDVPFLLAGRAGNVFVMKGILQHPLNLSVKGKGGNTILHELVCGLNEILTKRDDSVNQIVESLMRRCPDLINSSNDVGNTPVFTAARNGQWFLLSLFLKHSKNVSVKGKGGNTILHELVCGLNKREMERDESVNPIVESLMRRCPDLINCPNDEGDTPVLTAARKGLWRLMFLFLKYSVNLSVKGKGGNNILHELVCGFNKGEMKRDESVNKIVESLVISCADLINFSNDVGNTPVFTAARNGQWFLLSLFLKHSKNVPVKGEGGNTILHELVCGSSERFAARKESDSNIEECLVKDYADMVNSTDDKEETPALAAARKDWWFLFSVFLQKMSDVRACDRRGNTLLHCLARSTSPEELQATFKAIIADTEELVETVQEVEGTEVSMQSVNNNWMVRETEALRYEFKVRNKTEKTALFLVIRKVHFSVVKMLLEQDVDVNIQKEEGRSFFRALAESYLLDYEYSKSEAVRRTVQSVLEKCQVCANYPNNRGETPLYLAFLRDNFCVADLLLEQAGPSVNRRDGGLTDKPQEAAGLSLGQEAVRTPLHGLAASEGLQWRLEFDSGLSERVSLWVKKFSHWVNHRDPEGNTPILLALRKGNIYVAEQLVQCGADLSVTDGEGNTAILLALRKENLCVAEQLVQCGADVSVTDARGNTVLHALAQMTAQIWLRDGPDEAVVVKMTELAKAAGVTPLTRNKEGKTALDVLKQLHEAWEHSVKMTFLDDPEYRFTERKGVRWYHILRDLWLS